MRNTTLLILFFGLCILSACTKDDIQPKKNEKLRLVSWGYNDEYTFHLEYDENGLLQSFNPQNNIAGTINIHRNMDGEIIKMGPHTYNYYLGKVTRIHDGTGSARLEYDNDGNIKSLVAQNYVIPNPYDNGARVHNINKSFVFDHLDRLSYVEEKEVEEEGNTSVASFRMQYEGENLSSVAEYDHWDGSIAPRYMRSIKFEYDDKTNPFYELEREHIGLSQTKTASRFTTECFGGHDISYVTPAFHANVDSKNNVTRKLYMTNDGAISGIYEADYVYNKQGYPTSYTYTMTWRPGLANEDITTSTVYLNYESAQ